MHGNQVVGLNLDILELWKFAICRFNCNCGV